MNDELYEAVFLAMQYHTAMNGISELDTEYQIIAKKIISILEEAEADNE